MSLRLFFVGIGSQLRSRVRAAVRRGRLEAEMESELANHLEHLTADMERAGHSRQEAVRRARIALGPATVHKEGMRASLGLRWFDEVGADLRYAVRMLRKSPGFTAAVRSIRCARTGGGRTSRFPPSLLP